MSTKNNSNENSKAIVFARVSTESQDYTEQVNRMLAVAIADGYKKENLIVISNKESTIKLAEQDRQGIQQLKDAVANDTAINAVYVFEISRLGRRMDVIASVVNWLSESHIQLVCDTPNIRLFERDGSLSMAAQLLIYIMGVMAQQEMIIKKERFANGKKRAKSEGRFVGGSVKFGYTLTEKKEIIVDESKTHIISEIFRMYADGQGNEAIANYMNEMGIAFRKSKTYTRSRVSKFICDEQYRKIVGDELFERAQAVREGKNKNTGKERKMALGERLIKCQDCGRNYRLVGRNYVCSGHKKEYADSGISVDGKALYCANNTNLNARYIDTTLAMWATSWYLKDLMADNSERQGRLQKELAEIPFKIIAIDQKIEKLSDKLEKMAENYEDGMYKDRQTFVNKRNTVLREIDDLKEQKEALETRKREIENSRESGLSLKNYCESLEDVENMSHSEIYEIVHNVIDRVEVEVEDGRKYWTIYKKDSDKKVTYWTCGKGAGVKLFEGQKGQSESEAMELTKVEVYNNPTTVYKNLLIGGESQRKEDNE